MIIKNDPLLCVNVESDIDSIIKKIMIENPIIWSLFIIFDFLQFFNKLKIIIFFLQKKQKINKPTIPYCASDG